MLKYKVRNVVPPGNRYFYTVSETDTGFEHSVQSQLELMVQEHLVVNKLPVPADLSALIEDYICRHVPESFCFGEDEGRPRARVVTIFTVKDATQRLFAVNRKFVEQVVANRRASVCAQCTRNVLGACSSCTGLPSWVAGLLERRLTPLDKSLGLCYIDGSMLTAKVFAAASQVSQPDGHPENCWLPRELAEVV